MGLVAFPVEFMRKPEVSPLSGPKAPGSLLGVLVGSSHARANHARPPALSGRWSVQQAINSATVATRCSSLRFTGMP